jgi:predicted RNA-binding protein YlxR (DUF448 family)
MANIVMKKIPERKCMGCNEKRPKKELVRVVRVPDGSVELDVNGKKNGRGAYICPKISCYEKALKTKRLERCLETPIPDTVYDDVKAHLKEE